MAEGLEDIGAALHWEEAERRQWVEVRKGEVKGEGPLSNPAPPCGHPAPGELGNPRVPPVGRRRGCRSVQRAEPGLKGGGCLKEGEMLQTHSHGAGEVL